MIRLPAARACTGLLLGSCVAIAGLIPEAAQAQDPGRRELAALVKKRVGRMNDLQTHPFFGDFNGDGRNDALVVAYYANRDGGNSYEIKVMLFEGQAGGFRFIRAVQDVYGEAPRAAKFARGQVRITLMTLGPNDPRCCPSVPKEYVIAAP